MTKYSKSGIYLLTIISTLILSNALSTMRLTQYLIKHIN